MGKSSYLSNLGKGFVRSAVNQVGRDAGRVISNQTFGDAHSAPIRGAGNIPPPLPNYEMQSCSDLIYVPETTKGKFVAWLFAIVFSCGIFSIIAFLKGLSIYNKKSLKYMRYEVRKVPIIDRRYKYNIRGYETQQGYYYYDIPIHQANPIDVKKNKNTSLMLMIISGVVMFLLAKAIFHLTTKSDANKQNTELVSTAPSTTDSVKQAQ